MILFLGPVTGSPEFLFIERLIQILELTGKKPVLVSTTPLPTDMKEFLFEPVSRGFNKEYSSAIPTMQWGRPEDWSASLLGPSSIYLPCPSKGIQGQIPAVLNRNTHSVICNSPLEAENLHAAGLECTISVLPHNVGSSGCIVRNVDKEVKTFGVVTTGQWTDATDIIAMSFWDAYPEEEDVQLAVLMPGSVHQHRYDMASSISKAYQPFMDRRPTAQMVIVQDFKKWLNMIDVAIAIRRLGFYDQWLVKTAELGYPMMGTMVSSYSPWLPPDGCFPVVCDQTAMVVSPDHVGGRAHLLGSTAQVPSKEQIAKVMRKTQRDAKELARGMSNLRKETASIPVAEASDKIEEIVCQG